MRKPPDRTREKTPAAGTAGVLDAKTHNRKFERTRPMDSIAQPPVDASEISLAVQLIPVQFHADTLILVEHNAQPYVVMKPLVTSLGLDWRSQYVKLMEKFGAVVVVCTTTGSDGKQYQMICLPLRMFPGWLYSLNPAKLREELRPKVVRYQAESSEVLWVHWTRQHPIQKSRGGGGDSHDKLLARRASLRKELSLCTSLGAAVDAYSDYLMVSANLGQSAAPMVDLAPGVRQAVFALEGGAA